MKDLLVTKEDFTNKLNEAATTIPNLEKRLAVNAMKVLVRHPESIEMPMDEYWPEEGIGACTPWDIEGLGWCYIDNAVSLTNGDSGEAYGIFDRSKVGDMCYNVWSELRKPAYQMNEEYLTMLNEIRMNKAEGWIIDEVIKNFCTE